MEMSRTRARWQPRDDVVVEGDETSSIPLAVHQKGQGGREHGAILHLAHRRAAAIGHRRADVQYQVAFEIGFFLEFLDVMPIASRVDLPVECREIVAREVLPVLSELNAEALVGTAMQARKESFHHRPRLQLNHPEPSANGGTQE